MTQFKVLILEDSPEDFELLQRRLGKTGLDLNLKQVVTKAEYIDSLQNFAPDIIISDYKLPEIDGLSALSLAKKYNPNIPFIMVSGVIDDSFASETLKAGVSDYILKDRPERLGSAVQRMLLEPERIAREASKKGKAETSMLLEATQSVLRYQEFADTARSINDSCRKLIGATGGYVALLSEDETRDKILFLDTGGLPNKPDSSGSTPIRGLHAEAYRTGKTVYHNESSKSGSTKLLLGRDGGFANILFAPLKIDGKAVGLLSLVNKPSGFTDEDARIASAFAEIAAVALRNSELLKSAKENEQKFLAIFNNKLHGLVLGRVVTDEKNQPIDYILLEVNDAFEKITGLRKENIICKTATEAIPGFGKAILKIYGSAVMKGEETSFEHFEPTSKRWYSVNLYSNEKYDFISIFSDITKRKRAEQQLTLQANIISQASDAILGFDNNHLITYFNESAERLFEIKASEVLGRLLTEAHVYLWKKAAAAEEEEEEEEAFKNYLARAGLWRGRNTYVKRSGEIMHVETSISVVKDAAGDRAGYVAAIRDITDQVNAEDERKQVEEALRKARDELEIRVQERTAELTKVNKALRAEIVERRRMEKSLRESEEQYRRLIDTAQEGVWVVDTEAKTTYVNQRMAEMLGYTREELVGRSSIDMLDSSDRAGAKRRWRKGKEDLKVVSDIHYRRKDGSDLWAIVSTSQLLDEKGNFIGILGMFTDITERKQAEEKIREQAALLDKSHDAVLVRDLENRILYWNRGAEHQYGWNANEAVGINADHLIYKKPSVSSEARKSVLEIGEWNGELHQVTRDGQEIIVESRWTLVRDDEGKPKSILIINTDITEKKKLEARLLRSQRLESVGMLANGIAHDLNNVLSPIMISLELLRDEVKADGEGQKTIDLLEKSSERAANLVKQIQSFTLGAEGEHEALQISHIISEVGQIMRETFPRNIEIKTDAAKKPSTILGDSTQLHQVLMNLCVNARDAMMPDGGILSISAENFNVDENYARANIEAKVGQYVVITVSDTGTGIPQEIQERMFEPFFTTKQFGKGTGLGLSTALSIVKGHGGFMNAYSEVGNGSSFKVYLPAIETGKTQETTEELKIPSGNNETVLVVEDETSIREITKSTLQKYGYNVLTASDGVEAVATYTKNRGKINVVLMDLMMPSMDGEASIKALRKMNPKVKIIAVSGLVEKDRNAYVRDTVQALLPKPYTAEKLLRTLHEAMNKEQSKHLEAARVLPK
ncbi:MAG: PAS domain S-box protein [Thaumarchaeota archaeon]|nr:PAS domain S-box protein [Nitrososphaerota archaeon]